MPTRGRWPYMASRDPHRSRCSHKDSKDAGRQFGRVSSNAALLPREEAIEKAARAAIEKRTGKKMVAKKKKDKEGARRRGWWSRQGARGRWRSRDPHSQGLTKRPPKRRHREGRAPVEKDREVRQEKEGEGDGQRPCSTTRRRTCSSCSARRTTTRASTRSSLSLTRCCGRTRTE